MKRMILFVFATFIALGSFSQENFQWDKIDSVNKSKDQIYSDTKLFIAEKWKSAAAVIQNADKEDGNILVKGEAHMTSSYLLNAHKFSFSYTVRFFMKDKKYRIQIDNVSNYSHTCQGNIWNNVKPVDNYEGDTNLPEKKGREMFAQLKAQLQSIVDDYSTYIKQDSGNKSDW